jgi:hypothetical protein
MEYDVGDGGFVGWFGGRSGRFGDCVGWFGLAPSHGVREGGWLGGVRLVKKEMDDQLLLVCMTRRKKKETNAKVKVHNRMSRIDKRGRQTPSAVLHKRISRKDYPLPALKTPVKTVSTHSSVFFCIKYQSFCVGNAMPPVRLGHRSLAVQLTRALLSSPRSINSAKYFCIQYRCFCVASNTSSPPGTSSINRTLLA